MNYRELGTTGLRVSEIGFGAEWMEKKSFDDVQIGRASCRERV